MPIAGNSKTPIRLSVAALAGLAAVALSGCDAVSPASGTPTARQVTVVGAGEVQGTPDTVTTNVGISFTGTDAVSVLNQTNERQQAVIDALVGGGVDRDNIATTGATLQPQYGPDGTTPAGYQSTNTIDVRIHDVDAASRALPLIANIGGNATRINSVTFSIDDDSDLVRDARARAFEDAKSRAEQYAELSGLTLGDVISISEATDGSTPPAPTPMPRAMAADVPLSPGQQTVSFSVTAIWELR
ncbi:SIMPL domain-containing protein [Mycolicibacterium confluentis]|uniref:Uncharacterized protein n=1 Tax=Mycolicibacterium confluentis TaxID=28047 RepID=A0A7I7XQE1_9MYCO|nr:SIMPL domain-containing protein [Mycolicibacterium confluentis]MCV7322391.1 SIMPL domain-containing protein [Mycolicibacterium confluentis]ORV28561.1 hypothetical protein AWB99_17275 [Mycolicibacterium confluentis]BBZ31439.1 hypothetical protein MCNF_00440 [Mycolicibacterium confluentis]